MPFWVPVAAGGRGPSVLGLADGSDGTGACAVAGVCGRDDGSPGAACFDEEAPGRGSVEASFAACTVCAGGLPDGGDACSSSLMREAAVRECGDLGYFSWKARKSATFLLLRIAAHARSSSAGWAGIAAGTALETVGVDCADDFPAVAGAVSCDFAVALVAVAGLSGNVIVFVVDDGSGDFPCATDGVTDVSDGVLGFVSCGRALLTGALPAMSAAADEFVAPGDVVAAGGGAGISSAAGDFTASFGVGVVGRDSTDVAPVTLGAAGTVVATTVFPSRSCNSQ